MTGATAAPRGPAFRPRRHPVGVPPFAKIALGVALLVGIGIALKAISSPGQPPACVFSCSSPPVGRIERGQASFTSPTWGFSFDYPRGGSRVALTGNGVVGLTYKLGGTFAGEVAVAAGHGSYSPAALISSEASKLNGLGITNVQDAGPMYGAEIGFLPADGEFYSGQYDDPTGLLLPVQTGIVAIQHAGEWLYMVGVSAESASDHTPVTFGVFDDILDRWRWSR